MSLIGNNTDFQDLLGQSASSLLVEAEDVTIDDSLTLDYSTPNTNLVVDANKKVVSEAKDSFVDVADQITWSNVGRVFTATLPQDINITSDVEFNTINTGHGFNELYEMDQDVLTTSDVDFNSLTLFDPLCLKTDNQYYMKVGPVIGGTAFTEDRTLTIGLDNGNRKLAMQGDVTFNNTSTIFIDQSLLTTSDVDFNSVTCATGTGSIIMNGSGIQQNTTNLGMKMALYSTLFGFGIQPAMLEIIGANANTDYRFGWGTSGDLEEVARFDGETKTLHVDNVETGELYITTETDEFPTLLLSDSNDGFSSTGDSIYFYTSNVSRITMGGVAFRPTEDGEFQCGASTFKWSEMHTNLLACTNGITAGSVRVGAGSAGSPSLLINDTNTGFYGGTNIINVSCNGVHEYSFEGIGFSPAVTNTNNLGSSSIHWHFVYFNNIRCYDELQFLGANGINNIEMPTNLNNALTIMDSSADYMTFQTTTSDRKVIFEQDVEAGDLYADSVTCTTGTGTIIMNGSGIPQNTTNLGMKVALHSTTFGLGIQQSTIEIIGANANTDYRIGWGTSGSLNEVARFDGGTKTLHVDNVQSDRLYAGTGGNISPSITFISDQDTGFYGGTNSINIAIGGVAECVFDGTSLRPINDHGNANHYNLGTATRRFDEIRVWTVYRNSEVAISDIRHKNTVTDLSHGLEAVEQLRPITFKYNDPCSEVDESGNPMPCDKYDQVHYGFVAQEVEEVLDLVDKTEGCCRYDIEDDIHGMDNTQMVPILVKAIQELSQLVKDQRIEIDLLKSLVIV